MITASSAEQRRAAPNAVKMVAMRTITLFGKILESSHSGRTVIDVEPRMGDAPEFSLAGQISILDRQISDSTQTDGHDVLRIPEHVAGDLGHQPRGRKRR